jgi:hypothetical protein
MFGYNAIFLLEEEYYFGIQKILCMDGILLKLIEDE